MPGVIDLRRKRAALVDQAKNLIEMVNTRDGVMTAEERTQYDGWVATARELNANLTRMEELDTLMGAQPEGEPNKPVPGGSPPGQARPPQAPMFNRATRLGDDEVKAIAYYIRTNDPSAIYQVRASNNTGMNITTAADGGYAVPTGHYQGIIARRDEAMLRDKLGVMMIPGKGTTVNVPVDNEADGEFITKGEMGDDNSTNVFDRDAPALGVAAMTLVKYTKKIELTDELLEDEDSNLLSFIENFVGRGMAKTHNSLLVTEALANGTAALTLDSASVIDDSEVPELMYLLPDEYAEGDTVAWLMKRATEGKIRALVGSPFQFAPTPAGTVQQGLQRTLWDLTPVYNTAYMGAITASGKSMLLGNFEFMGNREAPGFSLLRDPYTVDGKVILKYYFRTVYKVLQAEAIIYATHPTA